MPKASLWEKIMIMFHLAPIKEVSRWFNTSIYFTREVQGTQLPSGLAAFRVLKALVRRYTVKAVGPANRPGYICVIRKDNLVRIGFSRRPKSKLIRIARVAKRMEEPQELVWYGFTEDMLTAKQQALTYFADYRADGDWLRITPIMAMTYFKRLSL
jgi:hypothetical protein